MKPFKTLLMLIIIALATGSVFGQPIVTKAYGYQNICSVINFAPDQAIPGDSIGHQTVAIFPWDSVVILRGPSDGTALSYDSFFVYCANANFVGTDSVLIFRYEIYNGITGLPDTNIVYLTVGPVIASNTFTVTLPENGEYYFPNNPNNGYFFDSIVWLSYSANGTLSTSFFTNPSYNPGSGFVGLDSVTFYSCQSNNGVPEGCDTFTAYFNVYGQGRGIVNALTPQGQCTAIWGLPGENSSVIIDARVLTSPLHGTYYDSAGVNPWYCADSTYVGTDSLKMYACEVNGNGVITVCDTFEVYINVTGTAYTTSQFVEPVSLNLCDTIRNNTNNQYVFNSILLLDAPVKGTVVSTPDYVVYCPNQSFLGQDSMKIFACETNAYGQPMGCDTFEVYLNVQTVGRNWFSVPLLENQCTGLADETHGWSGLENVEVLKSPANGTVTDTLGTNLLYCGNTGFAGTDSMQVYGCETNENGQITFCDTFEVYLNVIADTNLNTQIVSIFSGQCTTPSVSGVSLFLVDSPQAVTSARHGTVTTQGSQFMYCSYFGYVGPDTVVLNACGYANCQLDTFYFYILPVSYNNRPLTVNENSCYYSIYNFDESAYLDSVQIVIPPSHGTATPMDTFLSYCANPGYVGPDTLVVYTCAYYGPAAGRGSCGLDTFYYIVIPDTSASNISNYININENQCTFIGSNTNGLLSLDSVVVINQPTNGVATSLDSSLSYCPNNNFVGLDTIVVYACEYREQNGIYFNCHLDTFYCNVQTATHSNVLYEGVNPNQCDSFNFDNNNGFVFDSILTVISPPAFGQVSIDLTGADSVAHMITYCPDSEFLGQDSMVAYICEGPLVGNMSTPVSCDTMIIYFSLHQACNLTVILENDSACQGNTGRHYKPLTTGGAAPYQYSWSDGTIGSSDCVPPGTGICITVTDNNGCVANSCASNTCNISVVLAVDSVLCNGQPGLYNSIYGGTPPFTYNWTNGDTIGTTCGNLDNGGQPLCLSVTDAFGCAATGCYNPPTPGNCSFNYLQANPNSEQITFYPYADPGFTVSSVTWSFGDGTGSTTLTPVHDYPGAGTYYATMNLHYTSGDSCSSGQYIYVYSDTNFIVPYCQAYFSAYVSNDTVCFVNQSVYNDTSWQWDFGDGTGSSLQNPYHVYGTTGSWNVCLTTNSPDSLNGQGPCSSSYCQQVSNNSVQDLQAYLFHASTVTPGFPLYTYVAFYNNGTIRMNGTVTYRYPLGMHYTTAEPAPANIDATNRLLTFTYDSLLPGVADYAFVNLAVDSNLPLSTLVYDTMWVYPMAGDVNPADNISYITDSAVGAWDPNGKSVSPKGQGEKGLIDANTSAVSYLIHFQNTGSAPAHQVVVRDTMSDYIDLSTVRVTSASFAHVAQVIGNVLVVSFENINLPDTGTSLLASQGNFTVQANLKPGLLGGSQIFNTANIYFDANAVVVTNTVVNTIPGGLTNINSLGDLEFALMPNPASTEVMIKGGFDAASTYELDNMLGQPVMKGNLSLTGATLHTGDLSPGIYLVKVTSGSRIGTKRLALAR